MNKVRRQNIFKIVRDIEFIKGKIEVVRDEEQDYLDNMPENLQSSMRADDAQEVIDSLEEVLDMIDEIIDTLGGI